MERGSWESADVTQASNARMAEARPAPRGPTGPAPPPPQECVAMAMQFKEVRIRAAARRLPENV